MTPVVEGLVWRHERRVTFSGVKLRAFSTIVRLADGSLLLHSPAPELVDDLRALGPVKWLLVPNCFHHLGTPAVAKAFPDAKVVGPRSALARNKELRIDVELANAQLPECQLLPLRGVPFLDETVVYHAPSRTLIGADIVMTAGPTDHWSWRIAGRLTGCYEKIRVPPDVRKKVVDKTAAAQSIEAMRKIPAQRLLVAHADVIGEGWSDALAEAWRLVGVA